LLLLVSLASSSASEASTIEARLTELEKLYHEHLHNHYGIFEWSGAFHLPPATYSWPFLRLGAVYGMNDTTMHIAVIATDETVEDYTHDASPGELDGDELDELKIATSLCAPSRSASFVRWEEGDTSMQPGVCYTVSFDKSDDDTILSIAIATSAVYSIFTEHVPTEFRADAGLTRADGTLVKPLETALVKGVGMEEQEVEEPLLGELAQDAVGVAALVLSLVGLALGAAALCVACQAKTMANKGTPTVATFGPGIPMSAA